MKHTTLLLALVACAVWLLACGSSNEGGQPATDQTPPQIGTITGVADGGTYSGAVTINATATDNTGVTSFILVVGGTEIANSTGGSLSHSWNTTALADGSYTMVFTARDAAGNTDTESIDVTIDNSGGGGGGPTGTVQGKVFMPNGTDPVSGALVFAVDKGAAAVGDPPSEPYLVFTYSQANGSFELTNVPTGSQTFKIQKGGFEKTFDYTVAEGSNLLTDETTTLPAETGSGGSVGSMAVVTGSFDAIQNVLARLGLGDHDASGALVMGTETFTLIDGNGTLDDAEYQNFDDFFATPANFNDYRTIFLNCGNNYESDFFDNTAAVSALIAWVEDGGRLYCTDWSYDFCEQLFPQYVDFADSPAIDGLSATPEIPDLAQTGSGETSINATIEDANLLAWLDGLGATNPDDTVEIVDWLIAWAAIADVGTAVKVWARADVSYGFPAESGNRPITVTFNVGDGTVLFSSYHTEEEPQAELTPQDRILQYLVFEVL